MHHFFSLGILLCLYREPQPDKTQKAPQHKPQTPSTENPNPKTQSKTLTPKSQTTINEQIWDKSRENNPGKNIA